MFAVLITLVGLMALLKAVEVAMQTNLRNQMRDEAVQVAEVQMNHWRAMSFASISTCTNTGSCSAGMHKYGTAVIPSNLRGGAGKSYNVSRFTTAASDGSAVDLGIRVTWAFKNVSTAHEVHSVRATGS